METPAEIRERWSYLRGHLIQQLARFEDGTYHIMSDNKDVSAEAIFQLMLGFHCSRRQDTAQGRSHRLDLSDRDRMPVTASKTESY